MLPKRIPQSDHDAPRIFRLFDPDASPTPTPEQSPTNPPPPPRKKKPKRVQLRKIYERYQKPAAEEAGISAKHLADIERHLAAWESFWVSYRATTPPEQRIRYPLLPGITREHLELFRRHLKTKELADRTINKYLGSIRSILVTAENHSKIKRRPRLERLPERAADPARKIYFRDPQIDSLMRSAAHLEWPPKRSTGVDPATFWRCAIVLFRTYGFRVQELLAYERGKKPLTWSNISFEVETPNPSSEEQNELGWLVYTPEKTKRFKPTPIYLPLTRYTRAAIDLLLAGRRSSTGILMAMPRSQRSFFKAWRKLLSDAEVKPKVGKFKPLHFRKTCATHLSKHKAGLATAVCRWGSSKDDGAEAKVAMDHYIVDDSLLQELHNVPWPASFEEFATAVEQSKQS